MTKSIPNEILKKITSIEYGKRTMSFRVSFEANVNGNNAIEKAEIINFSEVLWCELYSRNFPEMILKTDLNILFYIFKVNNGQE